MSNVDIDPNTVIEYANNMDSALVEIGEILENVDKITHNAQWESKSADTYRQTYNEFKNNNYEQFKETMRNCINYLKKTANDYLEADADINSSAG